MRDKKTKHLKYYDKELSDDQILAYGKIIDKFKKGEINYERLKSMFLNFGVEVDVVLKDFSSEMMSISDGKIFKERINAKHYIYNDVKYFVLNSLALNDVIFRMDYKAIEVLSNAGIPEYQEAMFAMLKTQLRFSSDANEKLAAERESWRRKIVELESLLSDKDEINRSK